MSIELNILSSLSKRDNYYRFKDLLDKIALTTESKLIINDLNEYFESGITSVDWKDFSEWFKVKHPTKKSESIELYNSIFEKLESIEIAEQPESILKLLITREYAELIGSTALRVAEGEGSNLDEISELYDKYCKETGNVSDIEDHIVSDDIEELVSNTLVGGGYEWRLEELNVSVGPVRRGDFVVIGALPETGKSTFLCSEASHMATQMGDKTVIWFNNEEQGDKVKLRIVQAALGITNKDIISDPKKTMAEYKKLGIKVIVYDRAKIHYREVEKILDKYDPGLIIFDQLRKITGFKSNSEVNQLTELFSWGREIAKEYGPVLAVHQASGAALNQPWIDMSMLYYSQIGIQGEADAIITIADPKEHDATIRNLNIPKNKLSGGSRSVEKERHGKWQVNIVPEIARYKGVL